MTQSRPIYLLVASLVGLFLLLRFLEIWTPFPHGDALYYHLVGGRYWWETSLADMHRHFIPFFMAGLWDYLYVIPNALFGASLWTQISGQFMHMSCSLGLASLFMISYFKRSIWGFIGALMLLTIARSPDFFLYAKNDGVLAMLSLVAAVIIIEKNALRSFHPIMQTILIGIALGLLPSIKMNGLFVTIPLSLYYAWTRRHAWPHVLLAASIALIVWFPMLYRNAHYLGSPFYPGLVSRFPGTLSPGMLSYLTAGSMVPLNAATLLGYLKACFLGKMVFLIVPVLAYFNLRHFRPGNAYLILVLVFLGLQLIEPVMPTERYFFPCTFFLIFFIVKSLSYYPLKPWMILVFIAAILADSKIDKSIMRVIHTAKLYATAHSARDIVLAGSPMSALWNDIPENTLVISDRSSEVFYAAKGVRLHQYGATPEAEFLASCQLTDLHRLAPYSFAILALAEHNPCYDRILTDGKRLMSVDQYTLYDIRGIRYDLSEKQ